MTKRIAIFASGEGTNTQHLITYFKDTDIRISLVVCNNPSAKVLAKAADAHISTFLVSKESLNDEHVVAQKLLDEKTDLIVCAGFLLKIPNSILQSFPNKVVNIHPALLPKFGGKGMYGNKVHQAVIAAGETTSGITIHYVNEDYDEGAIILQKKCTVDKSDTPKSLSEKIHALEHVWYPPTILELLTEK